jgi:hypothetical protein
LVSLPLGIFNRLMHDKAWARWREVLRALTLLRSMNRIFPRKKTLFFLYDPSSAL